MLLRIMEVNEIGDSVTLIAGHRQQLPQQPGPVRTNR
jgi:hypothetical protein